MSDLIETLKNSDNNLLLAEAKGVDKWSKLRHTKNDLELLLTYNIAEIRFKPNRESDYINLVMTSNNRFIKVYSALKKEDKSKQAHSPFNGIKTKDRQSIMSYDLIEGKLKTVNLLSWQIVNFIPITEENVLILDQLVRDCLKK